MKNEETHETTLKQKHKLRLAQGQLKKARLGPIRVISISEVSVTSALLNSLENPVFDSQEPRPSISSISFGAKEVSISGPEF